MMFDGASQSNQCDGDKEYATASDTANNWQMHEI